jgi:putative copper resistance protein D
MAALTDMNALLVCSRALHFGAVLLLFGGLVFALAVVGPARRVAQPGAAAAGERLDRFLRAAGWWGLGVSLVSGAAWLLLEAALMSGKSVGEATSGAVLWVVLGGTGFGRVWMWRLILATALGALMFARAAAAGGRRPLMLARLALAGGYLGALALVGHAGDGQGSERTLRLAADAVHLLAAGAWLGALPGLAVLFTSASRASSNASISVAGRAARRFSILGIASVGALLGSGLLNAWYLVADVPALLGTPYGRLLLAKVALFALMVALAAINRQYLTPRVERGDAAALRRIARNAGVEIAAGIAIVAMVGALGVAIPAAHQSPVWPFSFALSLEPAEGSMLVRWLLGACIATPCVIALVLANTRRRKRRTAPRTAIAYGAMVAAAVLVGGWLSAVPAYPTSYAVSPVQYTTTAIARGALSYAANCAQCHGAQGRGDGPLAAMLPIRPADLAEHAAHHRPGELFWWVAQGVPNTPMSAYSPRLDDAQIWTLIQRLRALSEARMAPALTSRVGDFVPIAAPDFAFEVPPRAQQTLRQLRGQEVLLVSGVLPQSLPRLRQLESQRADLEQAGIRIVLMAANAGALPDAERALPGAPRLALAGPDVMETYAMFACPAAGSCAAPTPSHVEWLIDRAGYMRARWSGDPAAGAGRTAEILAGAKLLQQEPPRPLPRQEHGH